MSPHYDFRMGRPAANAVLCQREGCGHPQSAHRISHKGRQGLRPAFLECHRPGCGCEGMQREVRP